MHAHADDESITMGGTLAVLGDQGVRTALITCTDGQLATIVDPEMEEAATRPRLGAIRRDEMATAAGVLGLGEFHFLGYRDSGMAGAETNGDADAFWRVDINEAVGRVVERIRAFRPQVVVTYDANGGYGHPDHIQAHRITVLAIEAADQRQLYPDAGPTWRVSKLYYTAFPVSVAARAITMAAEAGEPSPFGDAAADDLPFATPDELVTAEVDVRNGIPRKRDALRAHRSQIAPDWPLLAMHEDAAADFFAHEYFQRAFTRVPSSERETDLFEGLRRRD